MKVARLNRKTRPKPPAITVIAQPFGTSLRWWILTCPHCARQHIVGDVPRGLYSRREARCHRGAYWIKQRR